MNLREAVEPKLNEKMKEQKRREALQVLKEGWSSIQPELGEAYLRLTFKSPRSIPGLLKNYSPKTLAKYISSIFTGPATPEEAKIQLLADLVISLIYPEKKIDPIMWEALPEIEKAYNVILHSGGGWASPSDKSQEMRKTAVLDWCRHKQAQLSYLKEEYLEDPILYQDGGGQEKRNFIIRLMINIIRDKANKELTFRKVDAHLKNLKNLKQPLRLEDL
jgi:hypothetical protein